MSTKCDTGPLKKNIPSAMIAMGHFRSLIRSISQERKIGAD